MTAPTHEPERRVTTPRAVSPYVPAGREGDAGAADGERSPSSVGTDDVPRGTTPTYELEMLISGTVTFGLLQLPPVLDAAYDTAGGGVVDASGVPLAVAWILAKAMINVLIASFVLHLAARAYWVGLVGLDSVFPGGIRRERFRAGGPITRDVHLRRVSPLPRTIARLDNVASTIFSIAFLEVLCVLSLGVAFASLAGLAWVASRIPKGDRPLKLLFLGTLLLALLFLVGGWAIDRLVGGRLRPGSALERLLRVRARVTYALSGVWVYGPLVYTLLTNVRRRYAYPLLALGMLGSVKLAIDDANQHSGGATARVGAHLPSRRDVWAVANGDYESLRPSEGAPRYAATIQSDVVEGPYVKLFVPYHPTHDEPAMRRACPELRPLRGPGDHRALRLSAVDSAEYARAFACLAHVRSVTLDGTPVANLAYRSYQHPASGTQGVVAYLPTDSLAKGMHVLFVRSAPDTTGKPRGGSEIVFWR